MTKSDYKQLSDLGEFGLIDHLTYSFQIKHSSTIKAVGDDAAVLDFKSKQIVVTTDLLVEGIHFNLSYVPLKHLGYKAVAVNLSDVCAMNAEPLQITVSIAVSNRFTLEALDDLYSGIHAACERYQIDLIGGDTTSSKQGLLISITAIGVLNDDTKPVYRSGAQENDLICVSGDLGAAYMGLQILERERRLFEQDASFKPSLDPYSYIIERQLKPEPRADIVSLLKHEKINITSMIDISDGLSSELMHICKASDKGCKIFEDKVPIAQETKDAAKDLNMNPIIAALNGGEDYELLFTTPLSSFEGINKIPGISIIGHISASDKNLLMITANGESIELKAQGWNALE